MSETVQTFDHPFALPGGAAYRARVCGRPGAGDSWLGWIELVAVDGSSVLRDPTEHRCEDRDALAAWAEGLVPADLAGAFERTRSRNRAGPPRPVDLQLPDALPPHASGTAPGGAGPDRPARFARSRGPHAPEPPAPVLDPFSIYHRGDERRLRHELAGLDAWHLRNIVRAFDLADEAAGDLADLDRPELAELIVRAARDRLG